jgi:hypothetical protein
VKGSQQLSRWKTKAGADDDEEDDDGPITAEEDQRVSERLERRVDPRLERFPGLGVVVVDERDGIHGARLDQGVVPDCADVVVLTLVRRLLEVVWAEGKGSG